MRTGSPSPSPSLRDDIAEYPSLEATEYVPEDTNTSSLQLGLDTQVEGAELTGESTTAPSQHQSVSSTSTPTAAITETTMSPSTEFQEAATNETLGLIEEIEIASAQTESSTTSRAIEFSILLVSAFTLCSVL